MAMGCNSLTSRECVPNDMHKGIQIDVANFEQSRVGGSEVELWHCQFGHFNVKNIYVFPKHI
jgi:hypothetical protein